LRHSLSRQQTGAFPLIVPSPASASQKAESSEEVGDNDFNALRYFGNLSPWYSNIDGYGLSDSSPSIPSGCEITQVHLLYRHGARYPSASHSVGCGDDVSMRSAATGAPPSAFAAKLSNATTFNATGPAAFLNSWQLGIGAELLTPFGRLQNFVRALARVSNFG
jgi:hypothetical protein